MQFNYDFPWYIQESAAFMALYTGFFNEAVKMSPLPFLEMLDLDNADSIEKIRAACYYYGVDATGVGAQDALIYNRREWGLRDEGEQNYYWNGRTTNDTLRLMANYIRAKVQIRGQPLSLVNLKKFYETALAGYNYSVENNIEIIESLQHFEIVVQATEEIIEAFIQMSYNDDWPFGKPVGISYNITYVLS